MRKTLAMRRIERRFGRPIEELLRSLYLDSGHTQEAVARTLGITRQTFNEWWREAERNGQAPRELAS